MVQQLSDGGRPEGGWQFGEVRRNTIVVAEAALLCQHHDGQSGERL